MSMDTEEWKRIQPAKVAPQKVRANASTATHAGGRNLVFRTLFPGVFVYLVAYHVFVHNPSVADFYCKGFLQKPQPHSHPTQQIIMEKDSNEPAVRSHTEISSLA